MCVLFIGDRRAQAWSIKYTTSLPCIGLSESDSEVYNDVEFREGKIHEHLTHILIYKDM